jgi:hypothetical protein
LTGLSSLLEAFLEAGCVRPVRQHHVVQAHAARHEAFFLGVVLAVDQAHEFAHDVAVIPGRAEGVFGHQPARREDDEIDIGGPLPPPSAPSAP